MDVMFRAKQFVRSWECMSEPKGQRSRLVSEDAVLLLAPFCDLSQRQFDDLNQTKSRAQKKAFAAMLGHGSMG